MFASDIHVGPDPSTSYTKKLGKVCAEVMRVCKIPFFVTGGDNCTQSSEFMPTVFTDNMKVVLEQLSPISQKIYYCLLETMMERQGHVNIMVKWFIIVFS